MKWKSEFLIILLVGSTLFAYSILYKLPLIQPNFYSDVSYVYLREYRDRQHVGLLPNWDYDIEYPVVIGFIIFITERASTASPFLIDSFNTFIFLNGLLQLVALIGSLVLLWKLQTILKFDKTRFYTYFLATVSFVMYGFYNWDMFVVFFTVLAIYLFLQKKLLKQFSGVALGLAIATKVIPIVMLPVLIQSLKTIKARIAYTCIVIGTWLALNLPIMLHNMDRFIFTYKWTVEYQLQNTWLSWFLEPIRDKTAGHYLGLGIILALLYIVLRVKRPLITKIECSWLAWYGAIFLFDPQMFLQIMPIALIGAFPIVAWRIADILNGGIIIFYFLRATHPELPTYLLNQIMGFGLVNSLAAIRQIIILVAFFWLAFPWLFKKHWKPDKAIVVAEPQKE